MARLVTLLIFIIALIAISLLASFLVFPNILREKKEETKQEAFLFSLSTPEDEEYTQTSLVKIIGKTVPQAIIVAYSNNAGEIAQAKTDGIFSIDFPLTKGLNEITIIAQNEVGEEKQETRDVFYDREGTILTSQESDLKKEGSASAIQEVKERIKKERERQKIKVYAGFVKGILAQNITLNTKKGSRTIRIKDDSKITIKDKAATLTEIQVEDYAIAVGRIDASGLLTQILIIFPDQKPQVSYQGLFGIVSETSETGLTIINQIKGEETKIVFDKTTKVKTSEKELTTLDIEVGNLVALVGKISEGKILAEKIFLDQKDFLGILKKLGKIATPSATSSATQSAR